MTDPRVAVIGGGIIGLSTSFHLTESGAEVRCFEKTHPGAEQSKGSTRIFRQAHGDPRLVALAMQAHQEWRAWEDRFKRRLVGDTGLILIGEELVPAWERAMTEAGAPSRRLSPQESQDLLPISQLPDTPALFDPSGGATRVRRTIDLLCAALGDRIQLVEVQGIEQRGSEYVVQTVAGSWECDEVVIAAGVETDKLAQPFGLDIPTDVEFHSRFTFEIRPGFRNRPQSCLIDDSGLIGPGWYSYAQPVGNTGRYAIGMHWEGQEAGPDVGADEVSRQSREITAAYVRELFPGLDPQPVDEIRCTSPKYSFLDRDDGFLARRKDRVTAFYGNNLFKFAPLIGVLLAQTVRTGQVPEALREAVSTV